MQTQRHGSPMLIASGYICLVDEGTCIGCEGCVEYCQFEALALDRFTMSVDAEKCMGCGVCVSKCEQGALSLVKEPARGEPLEIYGSD
jgi:heterodisulfide reductase subunit A-like polyferredoxin